MQASFKGAPEVMVKITGGGRDADGVQAHAEYIDRHGKLPIETDHGETLEGKAAAAQLINDWGLGYGDAAGRAHARRRAESGNRSSSTPARQAFNIILSMPPGTPPEKVLSAARKFARETFALQHRYAMTLHADLPNGHGKHPHVHLIVKAEHEHGGRRLSPRKADLRQWRETFAACLCELGVPATATRSADRGRVTTHKRGAIHHAMVRPARSDSAKRLITAAGDSTFMRKKLEALKRELRSSGAVQDQAAYAALLQSRAEVHGRYRDAARYLRGQGRLDEAMRFEAQLASLPAVQTEREQLAARVFNAVPARARSVGEAPRGR